MFVSLNKGGNTANNNNNNNNRNNVPNSYIENNTYYNRKFRNLRSLIHFQRQRDRTIVII